ncbi:MAG: phosphatase PAP2 family protein [Chthoniobacteraceae bacterium]
MIGRLKAEWRLKLVLLVMFNAVFWTGYQVLARHAFFPLRAVPVTWVDRAVPFAPEPWAWVYLSQFLFTGSLPLLLATREAIRCYSISLAMMSGAGFGTFLFFPTPGPHPPEAGGNLAMEWIAAGDGALNALPSLHAAFVVCMSALAWRMFGREHPWRVAIVVVVWGGAILFSTLATKQHYALDLVAGALVGWWADSLAWRGASAAATMPFKSGITSHRGAR